MPEVSNDQLLSLLRGTDLVDVVGRMTLEEAELLENKFRTIADHISCKVRELRYPPSGGQRAPKAA